MRRILRPSSVLVSLVCLAAAPCAAADAEHVATADEREFFEAKIRPVLVEHCYRCHSAEAEKIGGGLLLDTRDGLRRGGDSGRVMVPGQSEKSLLIAAPRHESLEMPPDRKLPDEVIAYFETWIRMGAPDPRKTKAPPPVRKTIDFAAAKQFWAFQPPQRHAPPQVREADRVRTASTPSSWRSSKKRA